MCHISITTYKCRGYNVFKQPYVNSLLLRSDILYLQEHWLSEGQLPLLNNINCDFLCVSVCGFSNDNVLRGRPYGGCAILFRKSLNASFKHIICNSRRMIAL